MLMEEFKSCLPCDIKTHLSDRGVDKLEKAAIMADDYELVRKYSFGSDPSHSKSKPWLKKGEKTGKQVQSNEPKPETSSGAKEKEKPAGSSGKPSWHKNRPVCSSCGKIGHTFENCFKGRDQLEKPVALLPANHKGYSRAKRSLRLISKSRNSRKIPWVILL